MMQYVVAALALMPVKALAFLETVTLQSELVDGPVTAENISVAHQMDWPKMSPGVNETSYEWWYFDVVSADASQTITVVFYNSGPQGFINTHFESGPLSASISGLFPNGTAWNLDSPATSAVFTRENEFSFATSADFEGSGFSFNGSDLGSGQIQYVVTVDLPEQGIQGSVTLNATAPARYPCGLDRPGQPQQAFPGVGWNTPIPGAVGSVDLVVNGTEISFGGYGYHDKNWGDVPFISTLRWTYWGHAVLGPYALTWSTANDSDGNLHYSGYVAEENGRVLLSGCGFEAVVVRPWGENSEYPPTISSRPPQGLEVVFNLDDGRMFGANLTTTAIAIDAGAYIRMAGTASGGFGGFNQTIYDGAALFESFKLSS